MQLEDLLHLVKRVARNTHNIEMVLDQVESLSDLVRDATPIVNDAVLMAVEQLDAMERRGYFRLPRRARSCWTRSSTTSARRTCASWATTS